MNESNIGRRIMWYDSNIKAAMLGIVKGESERFYYVQVASGETKQAMRRAGQMWAITTEPGKSSFENRALVEGIR